MEGIRGAAPGRGLSLVGRLRFNSARRTLSLVCTIPGCGLSTRHGEIVQNTGVLYSHAKYPAFWTETTMWTNSYTLEQTGEFLRDVCRAKGKRQDAFARELGVSHTTLSNLEQGKNTSTRTLELALQRLGLRLVIVPKTADVFVTEREG